MDLLSSLYGRFPPVGRSGFPFIRLQALSAWAGIHCNP